MKSKNETIDLQKNGRKPHWRTWQRLSTRLKRPSEKKVKQAIELNEEKFKLQQEATERALAEQRLELQQHAQKKRWSDENAQIDNHQV